MYILAKSKEENLCQLVEDCKRSGYLAQIFSLEEHAAEEDCLNPFSYFAAGQADVGAQPLFFNDLEVPAFWELSTNGEFGEMWNMGVKKGEISFRTDGYRSVAQVDWWNNQGAVLSRDYYNRAGWRYAQELFYTDKQVSLKIYYNQKQEEKVLVYPVQDRILFYQDVDLAHTFDSKASFYRYFLQDLLAQP